MTPAQVKEICGSKSNLKSTDASFGENSEERKQLIDQMRSLSNAFVGLQQVINMRGGTPPAQVPQGNLVRETVGQNQPSSSVPAPSSTNPAVDSLVKAALGVQGSAANALRNILPA